MELVGELPRGEGGSSPNWIGVLMRYAPCCLAGPLILGWVAVPLLCGADAEPGQSAHVAVGYVAIAQRCGLWGCATPHHRCGGTMPKLNVVGPGAKLMYGLIPARPPK